MYEKLINDLRECYNARSCQGCSRKSYDNSQDVRCWENLKLEAANAIESLEQENRFLKSMQRNLAKDISPSVLGAMVKNVLGD